MDNIALQYYLNRETHTGDLAVDLSNALYKQGEMDSKIGIIFIVMPIVCTSVCFVGYYSYRALSTIIDYVIPPLINYIIPLK